MQEVSARQQIVNEIVDEVQDDAPMPAPPPIQRLLVVGRTGSGKTSQIWTLPGKKYAYIFDPNSEASLVGCPGLATKVLRPEFTELDATLKGFNRGAKSDRPASRKEPTLYFQWLEDLNEKVENKFFEDYDWLIIDSLTFLTKAVMDRQMYINDRYGGIEDLADYRVVGSKLAEVFNSVTALPINLYCTGHIDSYQDEKTHKVEVQLSLPGKGRRMLPMMFTNIWQASVGESKDGKAQHTVRTRPDARGLQDIRSAMNTGLKDVEDVTIGDFSRAQSFGIGALLTRMGQIPKTAR